jgi:hypothetical protein
VITGAPSPPDGVAGLDPRGTGIEVITALPDVNIQCRRAGESGNDQSAKGDNAE